MHRADPIVAAALARLRAVWRHPRGISADAVAADIDALVRAVVPQMATSPHWSMRVGGTQGEQNRGPLARALATTAAVQETLNDIPTDEEWGALDEYVRAVRSNHLQLPPAPTDAELLAFESSSVVSVSLEHLGAGRHWFLRHMLSNPLAAFRHSADVEAVPPDRDVLAAIAHAFADIGSDETRRQGELHASLRISPRNSSAPKSLVEIQCSRCGSAAEQLQVSLITISVLLIEEMDDDVVLGDGDEIIEEVNPDRRRFAFSVHRHDTVGAGRTRIVQAFKREFPRCDSSSLLLRRLRLLRCSHKDSISGDLLNHESGDCCWLFDGNMWESYMEAGTELEVVSQMDYIQLADGTYGADLGRYLGVSAQAGFAFDSLAVVRSDPEPPARWGVDSFAGITTKWLPPAERHYLAFRAVLDDAWARHCALKQSGRYVQKSAAGLFVFRQLRRMCEFDFGNGKIPFDINSLPVSPIRRSLDHLRVSCDNNPGTCETLLFAIHEAANACQLQPNAAKSMASFRARTLLIGVLELVTQVGANDRPTQAACFLFGQVMKRQPPPPFLLGVLVRSVDVSTLPLDPLTVQKCSQTIDILRNRCFDSLASDFADIVDPDAAANSVQTRRDLLLWLLMSDCRETSRNAASLCRLLQRHAKLFPYFACFPVLQD